MAGKGQPRKIGFQSEAHHGRQLNPRNPDIPSLMSKKPPRPKKRGGSLGSS